MYTGRARCNLAGSLREAKVRVISIDHICTHRCRNTNKNVLYYPLFIYIRIWIVQFILRIVHTTHRIQYVLMAWRLDCCNDTHLLCNKEPFLYHEPLALPCYRFAYKCKFCPHLRNFFLRMIPTNIDPAWFLSPPVIFIIWITYWDMRKLSLQCSILPLRNPTRNI